MAASFCPRTQWNATPQLHGGSALVVSLKSMKLATFTLFLMLAIGNVHAGPETVGTISIAIPSDFKVQESHTKDSLGDLEVNQWRAEDGRIIEVLYYATQPKQDRGPVVTAHEETVEVAGQKTMLIETEVFFGATKKVLVVHLRFGDSTYILDAERMSKDEFKLFLKSVKLVKKEANTSPEPASISYRSSAVAVHVTNTTWLSFLSLGRFSCHE